LTKKHDVHPCPAVKNRYSIQLVAREKIRRKKSIIWEKKSKDNCGNSLFHKKTKTTTYQSIKI